MEWNDTRIEELGKLWHAGFSASQIARQLGGVSRSAVIGKVHRLGISFRPPPSGPRAPTVRAASVARSSSAGGVRRRIAPARAPAGTPALMAELLPTATVLTLTEKSCRWPIGDPDRAEFGFCGRERDGKGPYCQGHGSMGRRGGAKVAKSADIGRMARGYSDAPSPWSLLEASLDAADTAAVAMAL
jgi:GcrA cell cycle regulator